LSAAVGPVVNSIGPSAVVAALAEPAPAAPATPADVTATRIAPRAARVTWADVDGETSYRVERKVDGSAESWVVVARPLANVTSITNDGLLLGRTYLYRVVAMNEAGESAPSEAKSVTTPNESELPVRPTGLTATLVAPRAITLTWTDVANETGYVIERRIDGTTAAFAAVGETGANVTTFSQDGLLAGKTYLYRVRSRNALGTSEPSVAAAVATPPEDGTTVPAAPTGLVAELAAPRAARLRWNDVANETGYVIERRIDGTDAPFAAVGDTAADVTTFAQDGLLASRTYLYRVRARNAAGSSEPSNVASVTTPAEVPIPPVPADVRATLVEPRAARVTWNDVEGETGYTIERRIDGTDAPWARVGSVNGGVTTFTDAGLLAGRTYLYRVRSFNGAGSSEPSNVASVTTAPEVTIPAAPRELDAVLLGPRRVGVSWADVDGERGYKVERRLDGTDTWTQIRVVGENVTSIVDEAVDAGKTYFYRVRAFNTAGDSPYSNVDSVTTSDVPVGAPAAPHLESALVAPRSVRLTWTNVERETGYRLERRVDGTDGPWTLLATTGADVTTYLDEGLEPGKTYIYRVRAFNDAGESGNSNTAYRAIPRDVVVPAAPTGLDATLVEGRVRLAWNDVENERGYRVERRLDGSTEEWRQVGTTAANVTTFTDSSELLPGRTYVYRVRATNEAGVSAPSNTDSVQIPGDVGAPAATRLEAGVVSAHAIRLSWRDVEGETGYTIERRAEGTDAWTRVAATAANVTRYVDEGLDAGKTYQYRVRAFNEVGESPNSNVAFATTPGEDTRPAAPRDLRAAAASASVIELRWADVGNETGYKIERRLDGSTTWRQVGTTSADVTTFRDATVMARRTYIYRVRAFNASGDSPYSNTAVATTPRGDLVVGTGNGLLGTYFDNADFTDPRLRRIDPTVNFAWESRSPSPVIGVDSFSVRWTGRVQAQSTETYRFYTQADDGVRLWVNGELVIDDWNHHAVAERSGTVALEAGKLYDLRLEYFESNGAATARLLWGSGSVAKQVIPQSQLYAGTVELTPPQAVTVAPPQIAAARVATAGGAAHELLGESN
jgi:titin